MGRLHNAARKIVAKKKLDILIEFTRSPKPKMKCRRQSFTPFVFLNITFNDSGVICIENGGGDMAFYGKNEMEIQRAIKDIEWSISN